MEYSFQKVANFSKCPLSSDDNCFVWGEGSICGRYGEVWVLDAERCASAEFDLDRQPVPGTVGNQLSPTRQIFIRDTDH